MPRIVFLPGAFGNHDERLVRWWFEHVSNALPWEWPRLYVTYADEAGRPTRSIETAVDQASRQIFQWTAPGETYVIAYSAGAQVLRGLLARRPHLAARVVLLSGVGPNGFSNAAVLRTCLAAPLSILLGLLTGTLTFRSVGELWRVMYSGLSPFRPAASSMYTCQVQEERMYWWAAELFLPGLRRRLPPIPPRVSSLCVVPSGDLLMRDEPYTGERHTWLMVKGLHHAFVCASPACGTQITHFHEEVRSFLATP